MAKAKKHNTTTDPVYAAIEKHKKAMRELHVALRPVARNNGDRDPKKANKYGDREWDARDDLAETVPTTLQGLLTLLTYINGVTRGELSPSGRPDNAFETSDNLMDVLAGAEKLLAEQIGRHA
ncbi:hypothetical protein CT676_42685 [Bradyrhizobium sp. MOS001]|uniref:hypothetical protein n=1 Tax=unclassified Bradyrhizobium TaxID=2631580 RepID=UPI0010755FD0|nr:hypothetical protein [Bradyrhizobium sp. MOS001]TFW52274.1 hypothetical protein CT676_42685 [Bradyrhizobium sp. MOS001]